MECDVGVFVFWLELLLLATCCCTWKWHGCSCKRAVRVLCNWVHLCMLYSSRHIPLYWHIKDRLVCVYACVCMYVCMYVITGKSSDWIPAKQLAFTGACASCCAWEWWRSARIAFIWAWPEGTVEQHCNSLLQYICVPVTCCSMSASTCHNHLFHCFPYTVPLA